MSSSKFVARDRSEQEDDLHKLLSDFFSTAKSKTMGSFSSKFSQFAVEDIVYASEVYSQHNRIKLFYVLNDFESKVVFLYRSDTYSKKLLLQLLKDKDVAQLISAMPTDEAVKTIEVLPMVRCSKVLKIMPPKKASVICSHMKFAPETAGRFMDADFFAFDDSETVGNAVDYIKKNPDIDFLRRVFVLNNDNELMGYVPSRSLVTNHINVPLKDVMRPVTHYVGPSEGLFVVVEIFERYKVSDIPVLDSLGRLLGVVTYDDIIDYIEDKNEKTLAIISGTESPIQSKHSLLHSVASRMPWLTITLASGLMNAGNISSLSDSCKMLVHFVPLINGMSGNVGLQCSTVIVRGMATGIVTPSSVLYFAFKEMSTGVVSGVLFGFLAGCIVIVIQSVSSIYSSNFLPVHLGIIVCGGLSGACIFATVLGVIFPVVFDKIGVDPAVASGPIVTAINDICSTLMYFLISGILLSLMGV